MSRIRTNATIAWVAVTGSLMTLMAGAQTAPKATSTIIEQTEYFALPGKAEEVYQWRIQACDVLEKIGLPRGHVLRRQGNSDTLADVMWQIEYPDETARQRNLKIRLESAEFAAVRDHMKTLISHSEQGIWQQN
ncbi:MAG TPA: hypothetical protein VHR45_15615 [Thermoanaerobaculia bacterium]|nr:hypothetical protein [Thermoanaerobaculia bacterium]